MSPEQYDRVKAAVLSFLSKGGKLKRGAWGVVFRDGTWVDHLFVTSPPCVCALGAFVLETQPAPVLGPIGEAWPCETIAHALGTRSGLVMSFATGFDGTSAYRGHEAAPEEMRAWYRAGVRLREELVVAGHLRHTFSVEF